MPDDQSFSAAPLICGKCKQPYHVILIRGDGTITQVVCPQCESASNVENGRLILPRPPQWSGPSKEHQQ